MLNRLLMMDVTEVADRSWQQASKWLDRTALKMPATSLARSASVRRETVRRDQAARFRTAGLSRFFAGAVDAATPGLVTSLAPGARETTLHSAERIGSGFFDLLGYEGLFFGDPVDWRLDPLSGTRTPLDHWSAIDPTDARSVGDVKVVWELNRQQFLVTLGLAYRLSGDEGQAATFVRLFRSWTRENPVSLGINWASSLEVALRVVAWSWALLLFQRSPHLTVGLVADIHGALESHASHIERYLSTHTSPNTHLTVEALGLFYAGVVFPEGDSARRWRNLGQGILEDQIQRQVLPDGVYFEQATAYQIYTVWIYLHYLILAAQNGLPAAPATGALVQRMLDALLALRRPDGGIPAIGDEDGGALLPLAPRTPQDARGLFATAAGFFVRADYAWAADGIQPEALWLLGPTVISTFESFTAAPPVEASRVFIDGGYVVMRSGWQRNAHHLVFDTGPLGCSMTAAHGHADLLSVQVSPFGEPCIVDPGTYAYASDPEFRAHFRSTEAHSTITVDGLGQAEPKGPFGWSARPTALLHRFVSTPAFDLADASHRAYGRLADPVVHRRRVVFVRSPGYWVIVDDLGALLEHRIDHRFQFAPLAVTATADSWFSAASAAGSSLHVRAFAARPLRARIESGATTPIAGWVSPQYGRRMEAPVVVFSTTATLPLRILTLLYPTPDASPPPRVRLLQEHAGPSGLVFEDTHDAIRFDQDTVTVEGGPTWNA